MRASGKLRKLVASVLISVLSVGAGYCLNPVIKAPAWALAGHQAPSREAFESAETFSEIENSKALLNAECLRFLAELPTFQTGDLLWVDRQAYRKASPQRGDLVIARYHSDLVVKRVVGLPGEEVEITEGVLVVNGLPTIEPYLAHQGLLYVGKGTIARGKFALFGDNRALSSKSALPVITLQDHILGKVVFSMRLFPRRTHRGAEESKKPGPIPTGPSHKRFRRAEVPAAMRAVSAQVQPFEGKSDYFSVIA